MSVNAVLAQTFLPGVTNRNTGVLRHEIQVFDPQAWQSRLRRDTWQVYKCSCYNWWLNVPKWSTVILLLSELFTLLLIDFHPKLKSNIKELSKWSHRIDLSPLCFVVCFNFRFLIVQWQRGPVDWELTSRAWGEPISAWLFSFFFCTFFSVYFFYLTSLWIFSLYSHCCLFRASRDFCDNVFLAKYFQELITRSHHVLVSQGFLRQIILRTVLARIWKSF